MTIDENTPEHDGTLSSEPIVTSSDSGTRARRWNFEPEEMVGDRYRIVRFIAEGGIGAVWEAEDLELGGRVALKSLRAGHDANETSAARFRREVQLARRVTHPNVCRTYDSFTHTVEDEDGNEHARFLVVSMELLEGETLSDRITRDGPLSIDEAIPIVRQIVAGLAAAHAAGVIHRDLKARNIILVPGTNGPRAVITDFGLARPIESGKDPTLTESGALVGTPAYMAPEQILGREVTTASDVYSLGVVLYEMVTGTRPFSGGTAVSIAVERLKGPPRSPAAVRPGLPRHWEAGILRCLELEPSARYSRVEEIVDALEGRAVSKPAGRARNKTMRRQVIDRVVAVVLLLATVVVIGVAGSRFDRGVPAPSVDAHPTVTPEVVPRRSIAVLPFRNLSGGDENRWESLAVAEAIRGELAAAESLRTASTMEVARAVTELELQKESPVSRDALKWLHAQLGTDVAVEGSILDAPAGDQMRIDVRLVSQDTGEVLVAFSKAGSTNELSGLTSDLGADLRSYLGAPPLAPADVKAIAASRPTSRAVAALYVEGLWNLARSDARKATRVLGEAVRLEPSFAPAHAALADAWSSLGLRREAEDSAAVAVELSGDLSRAERLKCEARLAALRGEQDRAIEIYGALYRFFPDDLTYGLALAEGQISAGRNEEAAQTLASIEEIPGPGARDPRVELMHAKLARQRADYESMAEHAAVAVQNARAARAPLFAARGQLTRAEALRELGRYDEARATSLAAKEVFLEAGEPRSAAEATALVGSIEYYGGRYDEAEKAYAEALDALLEAGDVGEAARVANAEGGIPFVEGRLAAAERSMRRANALAKQAGDNQLDVASLINLAQLREMSGYGDEAVALAKGLKSRESSTFLDAASLYVLGRAELCRGNVGRARDALLEARELLHGTSSSRYEGMVLVELGKVELESGDLEKAVEAASGSLEIRDRLADRAMICESRVLLGEIALARGDATAAVAHVRSGLSAIEGGVAPSMAWSAREVLARALLASGSIAEAKQVLSGVEADRQEDPHIRIAVDRSRALILAADAERAEALDLLGRVETEARQYGIVPGRLWSQLEAVRIRMKENPSDASTLRLLSQLETEATQRGFGLVARNAARLMGATSTERSEL